MPVRCTPRRKSDDPDAPPRRSRRRPALIALMAAEAIATIVMRRRGYRIGPNAIVRCRRGHVFTTIWLPGASLKALRLGWWRFQRCPVGPHWGIVAPVREADLSEDELRSAREHRDIRLP